MMWKLWNKLFGWQYIRIMVYSNVYIVRLKYFGDDIWYGEYPHYNNLQFDLKRWHIESSAGIKNTYPLTYKLVDKRPKQKADVVQLKIVKNN